MTRDTTSPTSTDTAAGGAPDRRPSALQQGLQIARRDLLLEARVGEALLVTAPFGAIALLLVPLGVGTDVPLLRTVGPGLYWVVVLLFGVLVTLRSSSVEGPAQLAALRLAGVDAVTRLLGRAAASAVLLLAFELILFPVAVVLYDPDLSGWPALLVIAPGVAVGLALLGALADALAANLAMRNTLAPLLVVPLALPLLLAATQVHEGARYDRSPLPWLMLVLTVDAVLLLAAVVGAEPLEESI